MLLIIAIIVSFIPFFGVYLWLRNGVAKEEAHKKLCDRTLVQGFLTMLPVLLMSLIFNVLIALTGVKTANPLLYQALYTFIVLLAFADIVLAVILIVFTRKARKREKYTTRDILA